MQPEKSSEFLHSIAIRLAISTANGYFLVTEDKFNPKLPFRLLKQGESSREVARLLFYEITGIDLTQWAALQLRSIGFFETPTEPDRTVLFAIEMPETCYIMRDHNDRWLNAEDLLTFDAGRNIALASFLIACNYQGG